MQSAQKQQDVDPAEGGIGAKYRESLFGYQRIAKEIIASIEERLEELTARHSSEAQSTMSLRTPLGSWLLRGIIGLLLIAAILGGVLAWQWPRSEMVRSMVARTAPQPVIDLLSDRQDVAADQSQSSPADGSVQDASVFRSTSDSDRSNGVAPSIDQSQLVQRMARDIANLQDGIEQLRAGQDQLLRMMMRPSGLNAQARTTPARAVTPQQTTGLAPSPLLPLRRPAAAARAAPAQQ
jgi:hypothetical protein